MYNSQSQQSSNSIVVVLSHQGRSYVKEIAEAANRLGRGVHVISSRPAAAQLREGIEGVAAESVFSDEHFLTLKFAQEQITKFLMAGHDVVGVIATYEGYRRLAADLNRAVGAPDSPPEAISLALDKLRMRQTLTKARLSVARVRLLDEASLLSAKLSTNKAFIKPRRGAASFGTFSLAPHVEWNTIVDLQEQMRTDAQVSDLFGGQYDFIIEDYIPGIEVSFEVVCVSGKNHIVASHEKIRLVETESTVLENALASPVISLSPRYLSLAPPFLQSVTHALGLTDGALHIEARFDPHASRWEIIEVNPRMGGALVNNSVEIVTGGESMLSLWVEALTARGTQREEFQKKLDRLREAGRASRGGPAKGSVMRIYFGEPGRTVSAVKMAKTDPEPKILAAYVSPGQTLPTSKREIFIGDALWETDLATHASELEAILRASDEALQIEYADMEGKGA